MARPPSDNPQDRAEAAKKPVTKSKASANQPRSKNQPESSTAKKHEGWMDHQSPELQMTELREERDRGYGSEYIGNEYKDVEMGEVEKDDEKNKAA